MCFYKMMFLYRSKYRVTGRLSEVAGQIQISVGNDAADVCDPEGCAGGHRGSIPANR